jgi:hypothetical protein
VHIEEKSSGQTNLWHHAYHTVQCVWTLSAIEQYALREWHGAAPIAQDSRMNIAQFGFVSIGGPAVDFQIVVRDRFVQAPGLVSRHRVPLCNVYRATSIASVEVHLKNLELTLILLIMQLSRGKFFVSLYSLSITPISNISQDTERIRQHRDSGKLAKVH